MKKVELLSPAGNKECLYAAIHAGCDAVYISGTNYGARKYADNFTLEEIKEAVKYCHLYGVKLYITVNTIIYEEEIEELINYIRKLHEYNVDALIMQDLGIIKLVKEIFPNMEVHASTQAHTHNNEQTKLLEELQVSRIVYAREMSLQEIKNIKTPLEKEIFIHGALCVSYSGQCLFSSVFLNRSGNRGECAGMCRLPYELYENNKLIETSGKYLISPKELNSIENLKQILEEDIASLKIEGRMKSKEYVYFVTKIYRTLIDKYYNNEEMTITKQDYENIKNLYNREFTKGFLNNNTNNEFINIKSPKHQGTILGNVIEVKKDKIKIKLEAPIKQNDAVRFPNEEGMFANYIYNEKGLLINYANKNDIIYLDNKVNLKTKGQVLKTQDITLIKEVENLKEKKINISYKVIAKVNEPLQITITDENHEITIKTNKVEPSKKIPTTKEDIKEKLSKLGNTPFILNNIKFDIDENIFIPIKELNEIRRNLVEQLIEKRTENNKEIIENKEQINKTNIIQTNEISFLVRNEDQLKTLLTKKVNIYTEDYKLYQKYKNKNLYYRTPRVNNIVKEYQNENLLCGETGSIYKNNKNNNIVSDIYINVINTKTINLLENLNVKKIGLSPEIKEEQLKILLENYTKKYKTNPNLEILVYGKLELMVMKYCPLNTLINKGQKPCNICKNNNTYTLKDRNQKHLRLINNNCITNLMDYKNVNKIEKITEYKKLKITNFRIDLLDENEKEIEEIIKQLQKNGIIITEG